MIDKLSTSTTTDKCPKTFSLLLKHHVGFSGTTEKPTSRAPTDPSLDYSQAKSTKGRRCYNCNLDDHLSDDCKAPCKYCQTIGHRRWECNEPQAIAAREAHRSNSKPTAAKSDSMLIDVLAASKRPHSPIPSSSNDKRSKITDKQDTDHNVIRVDEIHPNRTHKHRDKVPSQVLSDEPIDAVALVNLPVFTFSLSLLFC